ncbi:MAG: DUF1501 domain-containing protein [Verrucomicrobiales bacterium]|nr:DUF1501 domain-containing protein [Verrucomicrobiales bacterium]
MLSISDRRRDRNCAGFHRRDFLRVGSLGLGGLSLPWLLQEKARAAAGQPSALRGKSVVLLFLQGGPPHIEMFDPKMDAPSDYCSAQGEVRTSFAGETFGATLPKLAKMAHKLSVVRSFGSKNGGHTYDKVTTGGNALKASMGSMFARLAGTNHPVSGLPSNVLVLPEAVQEGLKLEKNFESQAMHTLTQAGKLGSSFAAFNPSGSGDLKRDMELGVAGERFDDRKGLLGSLDGLRRQVEASAEFSELEVYQQQAYDIITRGVAEAFDLSKEDPRTIARYDTSGLFRMEDWTKFHNMKRTSNQLGKQMLLARRMCEAGCGFVTVSDCGWDLHADGNSAPGLTAMEPLGGQVDHAVAAFIEDLEARGIQEDVLLVVTAEMGRSPRRNGRGGRDHYGELTPLMVYGGGLKMGQIIGRSDKYAAKAASRPYGPENLLATMLGVLFDPGKLRLRADLPQEFNEILAYRPIEELV